MSNFILKDSDLKTFEKHWEEDIERDAKYQRENDAKLRAVKTVKTYEEFSDIVKAAHLQPLQRKEILEMHKKNIPWNNATSHQSYKEERIKICSLQSSQQNCECPDAVVPETPAEFVHTWNKLSGDGHRTLLLKMSPAKLAPMLQIEAPVGMLGDIALCLHPALDRSERAWQTQLLTTLISSARFSLNQQFMSCVEKKAFRQLLKAIDIDGDFKDKTRQIYKEYKLN